MLLKEGINNTSNELSDITFRIFFFRVTYSLPGLTLGKNIFSLKTEMRGKPLSHYTVKKIAQ